MLETYAVYCFNLSRLSVEFTGTRSQCLTWIRNRARNGMATHFYVVGRDTERVFTRLHNERY